MSKVAEQEAYIPTLPIIDTPFSRMTEHWLTYQNGMCRDFEMDYTRCASLVGRRRAATECQLYKEDLEECMYRIKTLSRFTSIQKERAKQGKYSEMPPKDSIRTWHMGNENDQNS